MALVILALFVVFSTEYSFWLGQPHFTVSCISWGGGESHATATIFGIVLLFAACVFLFLINLVAWCNQLSRNKMVGFIAGLMVIWAEPIFHSNEDLSFFCGQVATVLCELWLCHPRDER